MSNTVDSENVTVHLVVNYDSSVVLNPVEIIQHRCEGIRRLGLAAGAGSERGDASCVAFTVHHVGHWATIVTLFQNEIRKFILHEFEE